VSEILLVEDERVTRHRIQKVMEDAGHRVKAVATAAEAFETLRTRRVDLLLLDIWLPEVTGLELLAKMKESGIQLPVVVITADDTPTTLLEAVRAEAYAFLTKPIDPDDLVKTIQRALNGAPASRPIRVLSAKPNWIELALPCDRESAERIQGFLARLDADLDPAVRDAIGRVFREMLLNAVEWGGKLDPSREVRVTYLRAKKMILYRIADPGEGFRLADIDHAAVTNKDDAPMGHVFAREKKGLRPGGFGILMSQSLADELLYNEAQNEVVFVKYLEGP
jgi:CheY-like chemotaxis protein/anti-sigma regulatory factor (Ser/Thr protein kinase)